MTPEERLAQRQRFEAGMAEHWNSNPKRSKFHFAAMEINGQLHHYMDADTDNAWIGFQLAELLAKRKENEQGTPQDPGNAA